MNRVASKSHRRGCSEVGASLAELAFIFPLFATILLATVDGVQMLTAHVALTRTAYEAVRLASQTADLDFGVYGAGGEQPPYDSAHATLQGRVAELAGAYNSKLAGVTVTTARYEEYGEGAGAVQNVVGVTLKMDYKPLMKGFGTVSIGASNIGPYLFKN